ncbi:CocE/NonD family hydrolase [Pseudoxanthomonas indica]|uniref:Putative hydrolase, CocE/NonD family n=1 Tax=Pseudoxanthomonas indica TaxID=428993 RepID=A0A1T5KA51_9GAMM|nr:CocE/NonD family hydrolase [Pseudoxanthomonas indica]GGD47956.1 hypothetical protein GCM10007235_19750 [Pseudoxanthomonas indica]SKC60563.1 putative hydrolase, CocE/NonD family [Pseudoxanthomonas indica]
MKVLLAWLLFALSLCPLARAVEVPLPPGLQASMLDQAMPAVARATLASYRDEDPQRYLGTRFRLQLAAGQYNEAMASIRALRALRNDPPGQPPLYLQYEIHAQAKALQGARGLAYAPAWRMAFEQAFAPLDDKVALQAEFAFGGYLPRMRGELDAALAKVAGRRQLPLPEAIDLIRAWQVHAAYQQFQPLFAAGLADDDARRYAIDRDAWVRTADGADIAVLVVRPARAAPLPALLTFTIYANDDWAWADAKKAAAYGYAGVVAYTRGKGRSQAAIVPLEHDGADAAAVIDWIAAHSWNDGRVGMYGGSYSGYTAWAASKHRPAALKAIAASATMAPGIDVPMEGAVFLNFMVPWPLYVASNRTLDDARYGDSARWAALNERWYASGRAYRDLPMLDGSANPLFARWLQHPAYDSYWQAMTPQAEDFAAFDIPVFATTGYFDGAQIGALHYFREHLRQRPQADHTLLIGPYEHFTLQTGVPPTIQGYAPDPSARIDLQALRLAWFDHVLKGAAKPDLLADRINWQVMGADQWRHAPTLEAMATRTQTLCLLPGGADGVHRLAPRAQPDAVVTQRVDFTDRSDAAWTPPTNVVNRSLDPHAGLVFVSDAMTQDAELAGPFQGVLDFSTNKRDVDVVLAVYELNAEGEYLDLGWWLQRASYNADRRQRQLLPANAPHRLVVKDSRVLGRKLSAGSRLVVTLGVIKQPDRQLNLGSGKEPADETLADAGEPMEILWRGSSCLEFGLRE